MAAGIGLNLRTLGLGHILGVYATNGLTLMVDAQHDLFSVAWVHGKKVLQNPNHKIHGGLIVIEQQHPKPGRTLQQRRLPLLLRMRFLRFPVFFGWTHTKLIPMCSSHC